MYINYFIYVQKYPLGIIEIVGVCSRKPSLPTACLLYYSHNYYVNFTSDTKCEEVFLHTQQFSPTLAGYSTI